MNVNTINRRNFLSKSGMAAITAWLANASFAAAGNPRFKMGLQLYTIRDAMAKDAQGTLKTVAALSYEDLETYGFDPQNGSYYGFTATAFKQVLDHLGLTTSSGHYDLYRYLNAPEADLLSYVDRCMEGAHTLGQKYITWPWLAPEDRSLDQFRKLASKLNMVGAHIQKNSSLGFAYHNHDYEFTDQGGKNGYQVIMEQTDPALVKLQIDLYWVVRASGQSPAHFFSKQPGRFVMWHIKDMDRTTQDYTELGNGVIDYTQILPGFKTAGLEYYFLEQGGNFRTGDAMDSIKENAAFFQKHLKSLL